MRMDHQFKVGDIVRFKPRTNGAPGSPDLTVVATQPQSVSVACYDEEAIAKGIASNFNGTYFYGDLELITKKRAAKKK